MAGAASIGPRGSASALLACAALALAGCSGTAPSPAPAPAPSGVPTPSAAGPTGPIAVRAADTSCRVGASQAPAGRITFTITNDGSKATEFYLYGTGGRVMGEAVDIGPGLSRELAVEVPDGGTYTTACKPGIVGDGIRAPFAVTGAVTRPTGTNARLAEAAAGYRRYVASQLDALRSRTEEFAGAVRAGDADRAKALYPVTRTYWERIEPVAESFPDLDRRIDGREDDGRDPGVAWTGFHRLEKDLWVDGLRPDSGTTADQLVADVAEVRTRVAGLRLEPPELGRSARELLDEVNTRKIRGEENRYSHTDLWDVTANVEGARAAVAALRPVIDQKDPAMGPVLDGRFDGLEALLGSYRSGDGYRSYTSLAQSDIKRMTDAFDALAEEVSHVAAVVTS